jgi:alkylated DNA repair protein alkB family protein 5
MVVDTMVASKAVKSSSAAPALAEKRSSGEVVGGGAGFTLDPDPDPAKIEESLTYFPGFYNDGACSVVESWIDDTVARGSAGGLPGEHTVDETPFRSKFFFGFGYSYGRGMRGKEELLAAGSVAAIPEWMYWLLIKPLEDTGIVPPGWVDSVVMNDYRAGSSIVGHVDPPRLFARPIVTVSFFHPARLVFGASFDPERRIPPAYIQELSRGAVLLLDGYAANSVTHGIRPEDLQGTRRVSLILRHVIPGAPGYPMARLPDRCLMDNPMQLLSQVQGCWRDPPKGRRSQGRYYFVQGMLVTVLLGMGPKASSSFMRPPVPLDLWTLTPTADGILLNDWLLEQRGISQGALFWRSITGAFQEAWDAQDARECSSMWLRAQN